MKFLSRLAGVMVLIGMTMLVGCRLVGDFGKGGDSPANATSATNLLTGTVVLAKDVDTGLLAGIRGALASGTTLGKEIPFTGLTAQVFSYGQGASLAITLPVMVSASGTFSLSVPNTMGNLYVRVTNASETLILGTVVNDPAAVTAVSVTEESTAISFVVLAADGSGKFLRGTDVESQLSGNQFRAIVNLVAAGLGDLSKGTSLTGTDTLVTTAAGLVTAQTAGTATGTGTGTGTGTLPLQQWPANILAATPLSSPVLAALAGQHGQTARNALVSLSGTDLDAVVRAAVAVGIDLSAMTPAEAASDPVIQMALRVGTPLVFENTGALTAFLSGITEILSNTGGNEAGAVMAAALGMGVSSQITVVIPTGYAGQFEMLCLGVDPWKPDLSLASMTAFNASGLPILVPSASKTADLARWANTVPATGDLVNMVNTAFSRSSRQSTRSLRSIRASTAEMPAKITKKEFLIKWPEFVWYPRDRGQDFVIQCSIRAQLFQGEGGSKKWLRVIADDGENTAGFLNRGALYFKERDDKGYFQAGFHLELKTDSWLQFERRSPGDSDTGVHAVRLKNYSPKMTKSSTAFDVDYVEDGTRKSWTSSEEREFNADEFRGFSAYDKGLWVWDLMLVEKDYYGETLRLDATSKRPDYEQGTYDWQNMCSHDGHGDFNTHRVEWPMRVSRGTNQEGFHPRIQVCYSVVADESRTARFAMRQKQTVWNVWSEYNAGPEDFKNEYSAEITREFFVNFSKSSVKAPIWATNTYGNPGAKRVMQDDGNLVIYSSDGRAIWSSGTNGNPDAKLVMQEDGNLVIYGRKAIWSTNTAGRSGTVKRFKDGNLSLERRDERDDVVRIVWQTNTGGHPGSTITMQSDGNLVIYDQAGGVLWASNTSGNPGAYDVLQRDGNYVIYVDVPIWATGTSGNPGAYDVMQNDGNYVIYTKN
jgi:hypothetical protein